MTLTHAAPENAADPNRLVPHANLVGREPELAALSEFLRVSPPSRALVLTGEPGIGKTALWRAAVDEAEKRGVRVLSARLNDTEARTPFTVLIDLLDGVNGEALNGLPARQRSALEVALLRAEPTGAGPERHAVALGLLNGLRAMAAREPLLIAIDDIEWFDPLSSEVLSFAVRRLGDAPVGFLLARRPGGASALERALEPGLPSRLPVTPLSLEAIRRLLFARLGLRLSRALLRRVAEATVGNPLLVLELGRALVEDGVPGIGEDLPVPRAVEEMIGTGVAQLSDPMWVVLLAVALAGSLRMIELQAIADGLAIDCAADAGLLCVDTDRVRASHPLLAAAALKHSCARERRELHCALADVITEPERVALHRGLAAVGADARLAATVAEAAAGAATCGARHEAVRRAQLALRLTPGGSSQRAERLLALAEYLKTAGESQALADLLAPELDSLPHGAARVRARLLLDDGGERAPLLAFAHSQGDQALRAQVLATQAVQTAATRVERLTEVESSAMALLPAARRAGPESERPVLTALGWARALRGRPIDDLCRRFGAASGNPAAIADSPQVAAAQRMTWRGELTPARSTLTQLLSLADERGEGTSYALLRLHLCELELRAGEWDAAARLLEEWSESADPLAPCSYMRCRAALAAGRGAADEADRWADAAIAGAEEIGANGQRLEALRARGAAALLAHEPARAAASLRTVWEHTCREGVEEPGAFPVGPDLVEALAELDAVDEARAVSGRLRDLSEQRQHPWGLVTAQRCRAVADLATRGYHKPAAAALADAAGGYDRLGLRFDEARTLLSLGRAQRRYRKWGAARHSLERATAILDELGSPGWADQARSELDRVGARRPRPHGELTPTERRVVELAASGRANKEIARTLFVTVHTVEAHLKHAYAKLGVHSRAQLVHRLAGGD